MIVSCGANVSSMRWNMVIYVDVAIKCYDVPESAISNPVV